MSDEGSNERHDEKVHHPKHYNQHPSGVEAIEVCRHLDFDLGNAVKYLFRADHKGQRADDRRKALWYLRDAECSSNEIVDHLLPGAARRRSLHSALLTATYAMPGEDPLFLVLDSILYAMVGSDLRRVKQISDLRLSLESFYKTLHGAVP